MDCACSSIEILLVDDDEIFREALADNLRADGHAVEERASSRAALAAMNERDFAVLVSDYVMPGGTGIELADRFFALWGRSAVIVTAYRNPILQSQLASREYVALLRKPVDYAEIHGIVHRLQGAA